MLSSRVTQDEFDNYYDEVPGSVQFLQSYLVNGDTIPDVDLLAFSFVCLSRYEEYLDCEKDEHGRYISSHSLLSKNDVLDYPIVDYFLLWFRNYVSYTSDVSLELISHDNQDVTFDIDHYWKYLNRPIWLTFVGLGKDIVEGGVVRATERIKTLRGNSADPYDINEWSKRYQLDDVTFFILLNRRTHYDRGISPFKPELIDQLRRLASKNTIGIHPGYQTMEDQSALNTQVDHYDRVFSAVPTVSRQHYLRLTLPDTYRQLINVGINSDYSMGYAEELGFRAGTCRPFYWYDLSDNKATDLKVFPFSMMDITLAKYLGLPPNKAMEQSSLMLERSQLVKGTFRLVWHNSSPIWLDPWLAYKDVLEQFLPVKQQKE